MAKTITLKYASKCSDCGAALPVGARARWYGRGRVYGIGCHERAELAATGTDGPSAYERGDRSPGARASHYDRRGLYAVDGTCIGRANCGHEDYPCCGC